MMTGMRFLAIGTWSAVMALAWLSLDCGGESSNRAEPRAAAGEGADATGGVASGGAGPAGGRSGAYAGEFSLSAGGSGSGGAAGAAGEAGAAGVASPPLDCETALTRCGDTCVDLQRDVYHCGSCDNSCLFTLYPTCWQGNCIRLIGTGTGGYPPAPVPPNSGGTGGSGAP